MRFLLLIALTFCFSQSATAQDLYKWEKQEIKEILWPTHVANKSKKYAQFFGMYEDDLILYEKAYGHSNFPRKKAINDQSIFYTGTTGQIITALCILKLWSEKKLNLEDSVRKYFDFLPANFEGITIQHLLSHTSGIRGYYAFNNEKLTKDNTLDFYIDVWETLAHEQSIYFTPGEKQLFSRTNYWLLNKILEKVSGNKLQDFANEYIFRPLKMENTFFSTRRDLINKEEKSKTRTFYLHDGPQYEGIGEGGLYTSQSDMRRFGKAFFQEEFFKNKIIERLLKRTILNNGQSTNMGFAFITEIIINNRKAIRLPLNNMFSTRGFIYIPAIKTYFIHLNSHQFYYGQSIGKIQTMLYGDDWLDSLINNFEGIKYIEQVNFYNGKYINLNTGKSKTIELEFGQYLPDSKGIRYPPEPGKGQLFHRTSPVTPLSNSKFLFTKSNKIWEFIPNESGFKLFEYEFGELKNTYVKFKPIDYSNKKLEALTGTYKYSLNNIWPNVEIYVKNNKLYRRVVVSEHSTKLTPLGEDYFQTGYSGTISFTRDDEGKVTGYRVDKHSYDTFYEKIE